MDNRNPYHNYGDLQIIDYYTIQINKEAENKELTLPNIYRGGDKVWSKDAYSKCFGFNLCYTKEDLNEKRVKSAPSLLWMGEVKPYTNVEEASLKKDGTPYKRKMPTEKQKKNEGRVEPEYDPITHTWKYQTTKAVMEYISKDIQSFWYYYSPNRQVSTGLTHYDRFVVVGDFDIPFTENTIQELEAICSKYSIPHFTYLEEHLDSGHYQVGWILDEPFLFKLEGRRAYNRITRYVWDIFGSDANFKGWHIKNPNCDYLTRTYWYNDVVSKDELVATITNAHKADFKTPQVKKQKEEPLDLKLPTDSDFRPSTYVDDKSSRNCLLMKELRDWLFSYDKENGELPAYKDILNKANEISVVLGRLTHKGMLGTDEIIRTAKSVLEFVKRNRTEKGYSQRQKFGNLIKGCEKESNILDVYILWKKGYKTGKIREELGLKKDALNKYIRYVKDNYEIIKEGKLEQVIPNTIELSKINKTIKYKDLIEDVNRKLETIRNDREKI